MERPASVPGYSLGEKLGQGSFSVVYKALSLAPTSSGIRETVAIKCIEVRRANSTRGAQDNLISEISILKKLRHPHIVQLQDFRWDKSYIYLILEFCSGGDLSGFIRRQQSLPEAVARKFLRQLASAIKYLRSENISHMDLKPQNILLLSRHNPVLKVADFGFATYLQEFRRTETSFKGSPLYMAPEILTRRHYDARVDLWSIGVILFECLFGRAPFTCDSIQDLVRQVSSGEPVIIPSTHPNGFPLSDSCLHLLRNLLKHDPILRLTFDEFFSHPFVDLDHAPTLESWDKANHYASEADWKSSSNTVQSVKLYVKAIEHGMSALQMAESPRNREEMRSELRSWMRQAESLKSSLKPESDGLQSARTPDSLSEHDELLRLWSDTAQVAALFTVIAAAKELADKDNWEEARKKFELGVEVGLKLLKSEPEGRRKELLQKRVSRWLGQAEQISSYLELSRLNLSKMEEKEMAVVAAEEETESLARQQLCFIQ